MCDECVKLDKKIDHYRAHEGLGKLIEEMKAQKAALHPQQA